MPGEGVRSTPSRRHGHDTTRGWRVTVSATEQQHTYNAGTYPAPCPELTEIAALLLDISEEVRVLASEVEELKRTTAPEACGIGGSE